MAHIIEHSVFVERRLQKLKAKAHRTPHQRASETLLMREGFVFNKVTPAGSLLYIKREGDTKRVALIDTKGKITQHVWSKES